MGRVTRKNPRHKVGEKENELGVSREMTFIRRGSGPVATEKKSRVELVVKETPVEKLEGRRSTVERLEG